jgi:hypothetical protein
MSDNDVAVYNQTTDDWEDAPEPVATEVPDVERYLAFDAEDFGALTAKQRDIILFTLLKDALGETRWLNSRLNEYEEKAQLLMSEEGLSVLMQKVMGSGLMGMFGKF